MLTYLAFRMLSWISPRLPRAVGYALCDALAGLAYRFGHGARRTARANLGHVFGRRPPERVVREVFRSQARNYLDTFVIPSLTDRTLPRWATVEGVEHLEAALSGGRGVILAGMHLGSPTLAAQVLAAKGFKISVVVEPLEPPALFDLINGYRRGGGLSIISLNEPSIARSLIRELRSNRCVGLMMDRVLNENGAPIQFFDALATLPMGPATLALATGAAVCPSLSLRRSDGLVHGIIDPAIAIERTESRDADILTLTRRIVERFEYYIGQAPGQWTLFVPVWNRRPESPRC